MGMIGSVGKAALNFAGRNLLGVDFEKQRQLQEERARRDAWMEAILRGQAQGPPTPAAPVTNSGGEDISGAFGPLAPTPGKSKSYQDMLPLLTFGAMQGYKGAGDVASMLQAADKPPASMEGPDGIYERGQDGWRRAQAYPDKPPPIPFGWEMGPDGNPRPKKGGPADPDYIARTAGVRRDAVVSRPMPRAAGGGHKPNEIKWD